MSVTSIVVMLSVADMERAVAFYRDGLGFEVSMHTPYWSEVRCADARIGLHPGGDGSRRETGLNYQVTDLEADCARASTSGAVIEKPPEHRPSQRISIATLRDPEGNVFYLVQPITTGGEGWGDAKD